MPSASRFKACMGHCVMFGILLCLRKCMAIMDLPPGNICAPCMVSDCLPVPDHCVWPTAIFNHGP